ncbi:helix-turn-helix domain-containing protein [Clostridium sp. WILCCON 0269]|uniref:Helix-turn-helix domain-containing protein n=1 Tax=Candidatus Clostridium eludens TaxID=3381663 RepID=A0ABW8SMN3_9CLOT
MQFGERIKSLRLSNKLTATQLAKDIGVTREYLSRLENNAKSPSFELLEKLCGALNITLAEFFKTDSSDIIPEHFKKFIDENKNLTPEQLQKLNEFIKTLK